MARYKGLMLGAFAGTLLASAIAALSGREDLVKKVRGQAKDLADKAMTIKDNVVEEILERTESKKMRGRKSFAKGTLLGLLLGAGSAALLTPKSGKQLRKNISDRYQDVADRTQELALAVNGYKKPAKKMMRVLAHASPFAVKKKTKSRSKSRSRS